MAEATLLRKLSERSAQKDVLPGGWLVVILVFFTGALNYLDRTTITTMHESITTAIPMTDAQFGLLTSVFLWVYGLLSPFAGYFADRYGRSRIIIGSLLVWSVVTALTGFATTFEQLLVTRALMGISEAAYIPAALALIMDYHRGPTRSLATGINMVGIMLGSSLGFIGGWIAENHNWQLAFHIFGIIGVVYSLIVALKLRDVPEGLKKLSVENKDNKVNFFQGFKKLVNNKSFLIMLAFWGVLGAVGWVVVGWLPTYYQTHFQLSQAKAGVYATAYIYPAAIVGLLVGGYFSDRWSKKNPRGRILLPSIALCLAAVGIFIGGSTSVLWLAVILFVVYSMMRYCSDANLMPILCMVVDSRYRATGYGILNCFATIIGGIGIYAGGALRDMDINLGRVFQVVAILLIVCALLLNMVVLKKGIVKETNN